MACAVCDNLDLHRVQLGGKELLECLRCGFTWEQDWSSDDLIDGEKGYWEDSGLADRIQRAKTHLYRRVLRRVETERGGPGRVLDVGCGVGGFLVEAVGRGWQVAGVEPDPSRAATARERSGGRVVAGMLEQYDGEGGFDLITLWDVIMLAEDPVKLLARAQELLAPGGVIYVRFRNHHLLRELHNLCWVKRDRFLGVGDPLVVHPRNFGRLAFLYAVQRAGMIGHVENGPLTSGDPYGLSPRSVVLRVAKGVFRASTWVVRIVSGGRYYVSPTLDGWARTVDGASKTSGA